MSKLAKVTAEQHGRNVKAKSGLNRPILDQGWYEMRRQTEYRQLWRGRRMAQGFCTLWCNDTEFGSESSWLII